MRCPRSNRITWWGLSPGGKIKEVYPGYHGEIAIDPATGAILRISLMSELPPPYQAMQTAILVEYAPVTIGEQSYICPVRSVAFLKIPVAHAAGGAGAVGGQRADAVERRCLYAVSLVPLESADRDRRKRKWRCACGCSACRAPAGGCASSRARPLSDHPP